MALALQKDFSFLSEIINWLKGLSFTVEYDKEADGSITGEVIEFHALENAPTLKECEAKLISSMREWAIGRLNEVPYLLKILLSSDEEIKSCLIKNQEQGF